MKSKIAVSLGLFSLLFLCFNPAQAGIRDQFYGLDSLGGLSPSFEKLANPDKFNNSGVNPKFEELGNIKPEMDKLGSMDNPMNKVTLKPSFERLAGGTINFRDSVSLGFKKIGRPPRGKAGRFLAFFWTFFFFNPPRFSRGGGRQFF